MQHKTNVVQIEDDEPIIDSTKAFRDNGADVIHHQFPNLSHLEKYALLRTLLDNDCSEQFNKTQVADAVHQYVGYLTHREKWEVKNLDHKTRPIWFRDRQPK